MPLKDVRKIIDYWIRSADKDWTVVRSLWRQKHFIHVLITGHLAIEKYIKALVVWKTREHAPFGHDLLYLLGKTDMELEKEDESVLRAISNFQGQGRYPDWELKYYDLVDEAYTVHYFKEMERLRKWFKSELSKKS